jgi:hypothetical protein
VAASELSGSGHITRMTAGFFTHWKEKIVTLNTKQQGGGASMYVRATCTVKQIINQDRQRKEIHGWLFVRESEPREA